MGPYISTWKEYTNFKDRVRRREFFLAVLVHFIIVFSASFLDELFSLYPLPLSGGLISLVYAIVYLVPLMALLTRRARDTGLNWPSFVFIILNLIRFTQPFLFLYLIFMPSRKELIINDSELTNQ